MILLNSDNQYFLEQLFHLIKQLNLKYYSLDRKKNLPFLIRLELDQKILKIILDKNITNIHLPIGYSKIIEELEKIVKQIKISYVNFEYFPFKQEIHSRNKINKINLIHNQILMHLCIDKNGFDKRELYKIIWPIDKNYSINKLDTHITNLKNLLNTECNLKIKFESIGGKLKLIV